MPKAFECVEDHRFGFLMGILGGDSEKSRMGGNAGCTKAAAPAAVKSLRHPSTEKTHTPLAQCGAAF
jgi:hypothetical protein